MQVMWSCRAVPYINRPRSPPVRQPFKHKVGNPFWPTYTPKCLKKIILCHLQPLYLAIIPIWPILVNVRLYASCDESLWRVTCSSFRLGFHRDFEFVETHVLEHSVHCTCFIMVHDRLGGKTWWTSSSWRIGRIEDRGKYLGISAGLM